MQCYFLLLIPLFCSLMPLQAQEEANLQVDLKNPSYSDGILRTSEGGVIQAPGIRIQAKEIDYLRNRDSQVEHRLYAAGEIILDFGSCYFIGDSLTYDFNTGEGVLENGATSVEPWYFGGELIFLHADGSFTLFNGFVTTSPNQERDWEFICDRATLYEKRYLEAHDIKLKIFDVSTLWVPSLKTDLQGIFDAPVRYTFKWGGVQGVRGSMVYQVFNWNGFKTFARFDYRIKKGPGGGIETYYKSEDRKEEFNTINFIARDNSVSNPHEKTRFRFQGLYRNQIWNDKINIDLSWDKLSDRDMATDYNDRGLELDIAGRTQLLVRKQEETRIERFMSRVKINHFQSVKQQLPTLEVLWKPKLLGETGIYSESNLKASYLDFSYSNDILHVHDYKSTRMEGYQHFYKPFAYRYFTFTPDAGGRLIYYGTTPEGHKNLLAFATAGGEIKMSFSKASDCVKHVIEPYARFDYLTSPTISPSDHYIFDIDDGWFHTNTLKVGVSNQIYTKNSEGCLSRPFTIDLYTFGFFDTPTIDYLFPKIYCDISYLATPTLRESLESAWDLQHGELDHFNAKAEWTAAENLALRGEYRHRSAWDFRKADHRNFILDSYRSENRLRHSQLSDRRDTLLAALYFQFDPNWALEFEARHGWNRSTEPSYTEFEIDLIGTLRSAWNVKLSYQHKEGDDRVAFYFSIGLNKPNLAKCESMLPCLEW